MRRAFVLIICLFLFLSPAYSQQSVEERLQRLEQQVDRISKKLGLDSQLTTATAVNVSNIAFKYGQPNCSGKILPKPFYVICYDGSLKVPAWVGYHLTVADLKGTANRQNDFRPDPELPEENRAELSDYRASGFDRGHMAPAADFKRSATAMSETFLLSNMTPQTPNLNRIMWQKLEDEVRDLVRVHGEIYIFTGSLMLDENGNPVNLTTIGVHNVAVPAAFYKVILCVHKDGSREMFGFIMPNQRQRLSGTPKDYITTVRKIEQLSKIDFFAALPAAEQNRLESTKATDWPVEPE